MIYIRKQRQLMATTLYHYITLEKLPNRIITSHDANDSFR